MEQFANAPERTRSRTPWGGPETGWRVFDHPLARPPSVLCPHARTPVDKIDKSTKSRTTARQPRQPGRSTNTLADRPARTVRTPGPLSTKSTNRQNPGRHHASTSRRQDRMAPPFGSLVASGQRLQQLGLAQLDAGSVDQVQQLGHHHRGQLDAHSADQVQRQQGQPDHHHARAGHRSRQTGRPVPAATAGRPTAGQPGGLRSAPAAARSGSARRRLRRPGVAARPPPAAALILSICRFCRQGSVRLALSD